MLQAGDLLQGRYHIVRILGQGGMGAVYLAQHLLLGDMPVAIKSLLFPDDGARQQFQVEARLLATLRHPGLVEVKDFFIERDTCFLVMEFVEGRTLEEIAAASEAFLPVHQVVQWMVDICGVLTYLHTRTPPLIFRDLKPSNIMLDVSGHVRLIDFGIARDTNTETATYIRGAGTPGFAPVEQFGGTTDPRTDIYALGATAYTLLTRTLPPHSVQRATTGATLSLPSSINHHVGPKLGEVVERMMGLLPESRYQTAEEVAKALREAVQERVVAAASTQRRPPGRAETAHIAPAGGEPTELPEPLPSRLAATPRRCSVPVTAALLLGVVLILVGWFVRSGQNSPGPQPSANNVPVVSTTSVFVSDAGGGTVFNVESPAVRSPRLGSPFHLAVDKSRHLLYAANAEEHQIAVFDTADVKQPLRTFGTPDIETPGGLAIDATRDELYVGDMDRGVIQIYAGASQLTATARPSRKVVTGTTTYGLCLDGDRLYAALNGNRAVGVWNSRGAGPRQLLAGERTRIDGPDGLCVAGDTLYVADQSGLLLAFNKSATGDVAPSFVIEGLRSPTGVWVDAQGHIWCVDREAPAIVVFDSKRRQTRRITSSIGRPTGIVGIP